MLTGAISHNNGACPSFLPIITIQSQSKQIALHRTKQYICIPLLKSSLETGAPASVRDFHLYLVSYVSTFSSRHLIGRNNFNDSNKDEDIKHRAHY